MGYFVLNKKGVAQIERDVMLALQKNGERGKETAKRLTPVLTSYAQKSVHSVVLDDAGTAVRGDTLDENSNSLPDYPSFGRPTAIVGSNTALNPNQFTGTEGYYHGLELGQFSRKGDHMLATAMSEMIANLPDDLRDALS